MSLSTLNGIMLNKRSFVSHRFDRCKIDPTKVILVKWEYTETNGRLFHTSLISIKSILAKREYTETNGRLFNMSLIMVRVIMVKRNKLKQTIVCLNWSGLCKIDSW